VSAPLSPLLATAAESDGWHYAAWIAIDFRLLLFAALLAGLTAAGITALIVRSHRKRDYLALWLLTFVALFAFTVFFMNEVAQHPVFVVEALFPFP
jgi:hypothetical protein